MKEKLEKRREKKWKKFTNCPNYGYYSPKVDPPDQQFLVSSPKEVIAANDSSSLYRNVTARKNKRKKKVTQRSLKLNIGKKRRQGKNACY